ncbi:hypothetical protein P8Q88_00880 [Qipengyuania sp. XHP0207]|uniref:hypothetical protein n=1 Tax=Qipengyuania sp. XHP0207 TaxID=3038078 RepID=UPI0024201A2A|nr:hypothetical protein [Qipengyuania sp. XHP0207]MDG5746723.1 hypothetical protein [Qipengyuania sp. XHP0207]
MEKHDGHVHLDEEEASGGSKEGVVRWVLAGGLLLAIVLLSITWIIPALMQGDVEEEATVSGEISSIEDGGDGTDSIVGTGPSEQLGGETELTEDEQVVNEDGLEVIEN